MNYVLPINQASEIRNLCVRQRAHSFCALPFHKPCHPAFPSTGPLHLRPSFLPQRPLLCSAAIHHTFPQLNLHRARVRRNHGRLRSNGSIERAQTTVPALTHS
jgi:hypothetical protein